MQISLPHTRAFPLACVFPCASAVLCATQFLDDMPFFWNHAWWGEVTQHGIDGPKWMMRAVRGSLETRTTYVGGAQATVLLVARASRMRIRTTDEGDGADTFGNVARFVETEQVLSLKKKRKQTHNNLTTLFSSFFFIFFFCCCCC